MEKFDVLMAKNTGEGGSFYVQSKIYHAKQFIMAAYEQSYNVSDFNPKKMEENTNEKEKIKFR